MNPSYVGAVWMFAGNFAPYGFNFCDGSLQSISENTTLYTLLGTTYGGDGVQTFGLPDLRGRVAISQGQGPGLNNYVLGQMSGSETVTLNTNTMVKHTHLLNAGTAASPQAPVANISYINSAVANTAPVNFYSDVSPSVTLVNSTISAYGQGLPFEIIQPVTAISYVISLYGIYPSQN